MLQLLKTWFNHYQRTRFPQDDHNQRKTLSLWLWSRNKAQFSQWKSPGSPCPKKAWKSCNNKTMLTVFFYWKGVVPHEYSPLGQTINKEHYLKVLHQLREAIWWKWPQVWATADWQLHHDSVPAHASRLMQFFGETSNHTGDSAPLQSRFGALWLLDFPKTKITFEREEFSDYRWESGEYNRAADGVWKNCVRFQGAHFEGEWDVIVLCTMFLVSYTFSINVSISHIICLNTFWTDLMYSRIVLSFKISAAIPCFNSMGILGS